MDVLNLIKKGAHTAIIEAVKKCKYLSPEEECALIKRGNHEEIMTYLAEHYLEVDAFHEFIKRGNLNEVRFYLSTSSTVFIDVQTAKEILKLGSGVHDAFVDCIIRYQNEGYFDENTQLLDDIQCLIMQCGNHCAIRRYLYQKKLLKKAAKILQIHGIAEDILVFNLRQLHVRAY